MPEIKNTLLKGRMNKDLDERLVPNGEYRDALNINVSTSEESDVGAAQTILGNTRIEDVIDSENYICVGSIANEKTNKLYWFVKNDVSGIDAILEYDSKLDEVFYIFTDIKSNTDNAVLKFPTRTITGINIIDDLLFWTDGVGEPKKININHCKDGTIDLATHTQLVVLGDNLGDIEEEDITVIKKKPTNAPVAIPNFTKSSDASYSDKTSLFEKEFSRFAFRYKYQDNEYSAFGPFSNVVFNPEYVTNPHRKTGQSFIQYNSYNSFSITEPFNATMTNKIDSISIYNFIPPDIPRGVIEIEILYKQENSPVIYSIARLNKKDGSDNNYWESPGYNEGKAGFTSNYKGNYILSTENIYAALPENQFIRVFDTVPRKALAQEITGNRLVYGNYTQGYNMDLDSNGNDLYSIQIEADYEDREISFPVVDFNFSPQKSIKSLRNYQVGIVFGDEYGRETPVFTSENAGVRVPWSKSGSLGNASSSLALKASIASTYPSWASYFKFYIKETSTEYYNLIMDKAYIPTSQDDQDRNIPPDHIWISFFSSDRSKLDIEDHIILKTIITAQKDGQFPLNNKFKIIDIQNEAPESIAFEFNSLASIQEDSTGKLTAIFNEPGDYSIINETIDIVLDRLAFQDLALGQPGGVFGPMPFTEDSKTANTQDMFVSWYRVNTDNTKEYSEDYRISSIVTDSTNDKFRVKLRKRITSSDAALADNGSGAIDTEVVFNVFRKQRKELDQFAGRFFVKIAFDYVVDEVREITEEITGNYSTLADAKMKYWLDKYDDDSVNTSGALEYNEVGRIVNVDPNINEYNDAAAATINGRILGSTHAHAAGPTNTAANKAFKWQPLYNHCHPSGGPSDAFFIDNMYFAAGQGSQDTKYARYAIDIVRGQSVGAKSVGGVSIATKYNFARWMNTDNTSSLDSNKNYFEYAVAGLPGNTQQYIPMDYELNPLNGNLSSYPELSESFITRVQAANVGYTSGTWSSQTDSSGIAPLPQYPDWRWEPFAKDSSVGYEVKEFQSKPSNYNGQVFSNAARHVHLNANHPYVTSSPDWSDWDDRIVPAIIGSNASSYGGLSGDVTFDPTMIVNSMEGIFTSTYEHIYTLAALGGIGNKTFRKVSVVSNGGGNVITDNPYTVSLTAGAPVNRVFMHLSFLGPGEDLVSDNLDLTNAELTGPNCLGAYLQGIHGGGVFTKSRKFGLSNGWEFKRTPDWDSPQVIECESTSNPGGDSTLQGTRDVGYNASYQSLHEDQWNPTKNINGDPDGNIQKFIDQLNIPYSKFKFSDDPDEVFYTIRSVTKKYIYNHTPWKRRYVKRISYTLPSTFDEARDFSEEINLKAAGDSVEEAAVAWAIAKENGDSDEASKRSDLETKIKQFGKASNRRIVYILELEDENGNPLDPRNQTYNPVDANSGGSGIVAENGSARMEFLNYTPGITRGRVSNNPAIWETEPRENKDLEVYYEASNAIPTKLNAENIELYAPIGSRVVVPGIPGALFGTIDIEECNISSLSFNASNQTFNMGLSPGLNETNLSGSAINYGDGVEGPSIQIIRHDGSYTFMRSLAVGGLASFPGGGNYVTSLTVKHIPERDFDFGLSWYNCFSFGNGIESNRIRDQFNKMQIINGARASAVLNEPYVEENRKNGLIYSGIYNSISSTNNLNQFIIGEKITKDLNPTYGGIQKLFQRRISLVAFCEDRVVSIVSNKDALFNADGNPQLISSSKVLGDATPFVGNYGISQNPESFASESYRAYFTDKARGAVLRLSKDGITPISNQGMKDWFRDHLSSYDVILGTYDSYNDDYNITLTTLVELGYNIIRNSFLDYGTLSSASSNNNPELIANPNFNNATNTTWPYDLDNSPEEITNSDLDTAVTIYEYEPISQGYFQQADNSGSFLPPGSGLPGDPGIPAGFEQDIIYIDTTSPNFFDIHIRRPVIYQTKLGDNSVKDVASWFATDANNQWNPFNTSNVNKCQVGRHTLYGGMYGNYAGDKGLYFDRTYDGSPIGDSNDGLASGNNIIRNSFQGATPYEPTTGGSTTHPDNWGSGYGNVWSNSNFGGNIGTLLDDYDHGFTGKFSFGTYGKKQTGSQIGDDTNTDDVITFGYNDHVPFSYRHGIYHTAYGAFPGKFSINTNHWNPPAPTSGLNPSDQYDIEQQVFYDYPSNPTNTNFFSELSVLAGESIIIEVDYIIELGRQYLYDYDPNGDGPADGFANASSPQYNDTPPSDDKWAGFIGTGTGKIQNGDPIKDDNGNTFVVSSSNPIPNDGANIGVATSRDLWPYYYIHNKNTGVNTLNGAYRSPWYQPWAHTCKIELFDGSSLLDNDLIDDVVSLNNDNATWTDSNGNLESWVNSYTTQGGGHRDRYYSYMDSNTRAFNPGIYKVFGDHNVYGVVRTRIKVKMKDWIPDNQLPASPTQAEAKRNFVTTVCQELNLRITFNPYDYDQFGNGTRNTIHLYQVRVVKEKFGVSLPVNSQPSSPAVPELFDIPSYNVDGIATVDYSMSSVSTTDPVNVDLFEGGADLFNNPIISSDLIDVIDNGFSWKEINPSASGNNIYGDTTLYDSSTQVWQAYAYDQATSNLIALTSSFNSLLDDGYALVENTSSTEQYIIADVNYHTNQYALMSDHYFLLDIYDNDTGSGNIYVDGMFDSTSLSTAPLDGLVNGDSGFPTGMFGETDRHVNVDGSITVGMKLIRVDKPTYENGNFDYTVNLPYRHTSTSPLRAIFKVSANSDIKNSRSINSNSITFSDDKLHIRINEYTGIIEKIVLKNLGSYALWNNGNGYPANTPINLPSTGSVNSQGWLGNFGGGTYNPIYHAMSMPVQYVKNNEVNINNGPQAQYSNENTLWTNSSSYARWLMGRHVNALNNYTIVNNLSQATNPNEAPQPTNDGYEIIFEVGNEYYTNSMSPFKFLYRSYINATTERPGFLVENIDTPGTYKVIANFDGNTTLPNGDPWSLELDTGNGFEEISTTSSNATLSVNNGQSGTTTNWNNYYGSYIFYPQGGAMVCSIKSLSVKDRTGYLTFSSVNAADDWLFSGFDPTAFEENILWDNGSILINSTNEPTSNWFGQHPYTYAAQQLRNPLTNALARLEANKKYLLQFDITRISGSGGLEMFYINGAINKGFQIIELDNNHAVGQTDNVERVVEILDFAYPNYNVYGYHDIKDYFVIIPTSSSNISNYRIDNISLREAPQNIDIETYTLSYSEDVKGWTSFKSFILENGLSLSKKYYTFKNGGLYQHNLSDLYNNFYGDQYDSSITAVLNAEPSVIKSFKTLGYEGTQSKVNKYVEYTHNGNLSFLDIHNNLTQGDIYGTYHNLEDKDGWYVNSIITNKQRGVVLEFLEKEGKWFNYIKGDDGDFNDVEYISQHVGDLSFDGIGMISSATADPSGNRFIGSGSGNGNGNGNGTGGGTTGGGTTGGGATGSGGY